MRHFVLLVLIGTTLFACESKENKGIYIQKSIDYHFGDNKWSTFKGKFQISTKKEGESAVESTVILNKPNKFYKYISMHDDTLLVRGISKGKSFVSYNNKLIKDDTTFEKRKEIWKLDPKWWYSYHDFLFGIPFKLKSKSVLIDSNYVETMYDSIPIREYKVEFKEKADQPLWYFGFHKDSNNLKTVRFYWDKEKSGGERILFNGRILHDGYVFPASMKWYKLDENGFEEYLSTDYVKMVEKL